MSILRWMTVLWPGLPQLWLQGGWSALFLATGFSALVNLVVLATWGWIELLTPPTLVAAWCAVVFFWLGSMVAAVIQLPRLVQIPSADAAADLFRAAQGEYLMGHWFEAEAALNRLLEQNPGDVEGHLLLASLLRRIGQPAEGRERLRSLGALEGAGKWRFEIAREWQLLDAIAAPTAQNVQLENATTCGLPNAA